MFQIRDLFDSDPVVLHLAFCATMLVPMLSDTPLPTYQESIEGLPELSPRILHDRREHVFLVISGLFLGTLAMINVLGVTRFLDLSFTLPLVGVHIPVPLAVGVLPYPVTFLCTDLISEFYGRRRANAIVWVGFLINVWVLLFLWLGGVLPGSSHSDSAAFFHMRSLAFGGVIASMAAYLTAQFVDVQLYHFWFRLTGGRHLWLRNNGSTLVSQLVDAIVVTLFLYLFTVSALPLDSAKPLIPQLIELVVASYIFKLFAALLDTGPFYLLVYKLRRYLRLGTTPLPESTEQGTGNDPHGYTGAGDPILNHRTPVAA